MPTAAISAVRATFSFPVLNRLWKWMVPLALYAAIVVFVSARMPDLGGSRPPRFGIDAVLTSILFGWLMSFRANAAYARWWEARGLWGQLVNESRNLTIKAVRLLTANPPAARRLAELLTAFAAALKEHLELATRPPGLPHKPLALAGEVFGVIAGEKAAGHIDGWSFLALDEHARKLMDICGACERIRNTPLTASYRGLLRKGIAFYLLALPWFLAEDLEWLAVPAVAVIGYALLGLELIAEIIDNPFGEDGDDLPLGQLVSTIRTSVAQVAP